MKRLHLERLANPQLLALVAVLLINWLLFPNFFRITWQDGRLFGSVIDVLNRGAPVAILAIGMTGVIATKGVDLSVGAIMAVCGAVAATMVVAGYPTPVAVIAALGVGLTCGLWNGFLVAVLDIQPIVATLVLMVAGRGIAQLITEGYIVTLNDPALIFIGTGSFLGFPMAAVITLLLMMVVTLLVRRTAIGLFIQAIGVNRAAASLAGIHSRMLLMLVYALSGFCAAIAGIIVAADIRGADANNSGLWLELDAILAVVIGGTSMKGGEGSIIGTLIGILIIGVISNGLNLLGVAQGPQKMVKGLIIVVAVIIDVLRRRAAEQSK